MIKNKYYYNGLTTRERAACDELRIAIEYRNRWKENR